MRLKVQSTKSDKSSSNDFVCAVGWISAEETISCGDAQQLNKYNTIKDQWSEIAKLPDDIYPIDLHWNPKSLQKKSIQGNEVLALASTSGKLYLIQKNGKVEKCVEAHKGAVLCVRWSYDGALLTTGEDGALKIWSRSGMLRSQLAQITGAVYGAAWSPDNSRVVFVCGSSLFIRVLQATATSGTKLSQWKGHDGIILSVDWNSSNDLIITGGEDKKFRIWDSEGQNLFASAAHENPITAVCWSWNGCLFGVGSFDTLKLCDQAGWTHSIVKPSAGSFLRLAWSPDGSQLAAATSSGGQLIFHLIEKRETWKNYEVWLISSNVIETKDITHDAMKETLEFRDRVVQWSLCWDYLVVVTLTQCYVYSFKSWPLQGSSSSLFSSVKNWTTPIIFDMKDSLVSLISMSQKYFVLCDFGQLIIYSYNGKMVCSPKINLGRWDVLSNRTIAISNESLAICDKTDCKIVQFVEIPSGKVSNKITHSQDVLQITMDQFGTANDRILAFIDRNRDLYLACCKQVAAFKPTKIANMVHSIMFSFSTNMLAGLKENQLKIWTYPKAVYIDKDLLPKTTITINSQDIRQRTLIESFDEDFVILRRQDGSKVNFSATPFIVILLNYLDKEKWDEALKLCRRSKDDTLWATLAAASLQAKNTSIAEIAYANLNEHEKVYFLSSLRSASKEVKLAELSALCGDVNSAESSFLQKNQIARAIMLNISLHRWERALDIAEKYNAHLDTVCVYRQKFLEDTNRKEKDKRFLRLYSEIELDWDLVQEAIEKDMAK